MSPGTEPDLDRMNLSKSDAKRSLWWIEGDSGSAGHKAVAKTLRRLEASGGFWE